MLTLSDSSNGVKSFFVFVFFFLCVCACACMLVTQSYPTLCYPTDCSPPGLSVHGILQARILENSLLQRNFPTQGSNCGLLYCRQILYHLSSWEVFFFCTWVFFHCGGSDSKESACSAGELGSVPRLGRYPGERSDYLFQYSCLENSVDRGDWQATVQGVAKSWTQLSN